jgi:hypothetical protein
MNMGTSPYLQLAVYLRVALLSSAGLLFLTAATTIHPHGPPGCSHTSQSRTFPRLTIRRQKLHMTKEERTQISEQLPDGRRSEIGNGIRVVFQKKAV